MTKMTENPEIFNPQKSLSELNHELDHLNRKVKEFNLNKDHSNQEIQPNEVVDPVTAKEKLIAKFEETTAVLESIDYNTCKQRRPKKSIQALFKTMDDICLKLDITPQSEKIALQTTGQIMLKMNKHFEDYLKEKDLSKEQTEILHDFFYEQLGRINPRLINQNETPTQS